MLATVACTFDGKPEDGSLLISGVRIVDPSSGTVSAPSDLLIVGGTIREVRAGDSVAASEAQSVLPAAGLYALPGLIDVHAHLGDGGLGEQTEADREGALEQFLSYGVTTVFVPGGNGGNDDQMVRWKDRCGTGEIRCPGVFGSGALITAPGSHPISSIWELPVDADPDEVYGRGGVAFAANDDVEALLAFKLDRGVDAVKIVIEDAIGEVLPTPRLSNEQIAALVRESHRRGLRVYAHVSLAEHIADGVAAEIDGIMHSPDDSIPDPLLRQMARKRVFYVATLSLFDGFLDRARGQLGASHEPYALAGVSQRALDSLRAFEGSPFSPQQATAVLQSVFANLRRAAEAGVPLALGSDVNNPSIFPGYSAHEELELMVEAGLTPARALTAATTGGAAFLGQEDRLGRIAAGFEADLLLLRSNPLEDILATRDLVAVVHDGQVIEETVSSPSH